ncbi:4-alpha-glucanotransferase [Branchiibius sp. NY16-3462-2]|uniref:4-alpha-glucanotransferase n=1 Tax=Branchiibius sp. NY16-3462-2 TaxID=1807500 RepID=UPI000793759C|nr:4-alpha-glucanotransferase [Branchiibius sp. NY16-3462-2]KYH45512.1 4-alpha-glucanotransferase [Branchiibius sp. NY16-3462-2]
MAADSTTTDPKPSAALLELAGVCGVATEYHDWTGNHVQVGSDTIRAVLGALGVVVSDDESARAALEDQRSAAWRRTLPPVVVAREGWTPTVLIHLPHGEQFTAQVRLEDGGTVPVRTVEHVVEPLTIDKVLIGEAAVALPGDLPTGYHLLEVKIAGQPPQTAEVIVAPNTLDLPDSLAQQPAWGLAAQVYSVRSERSWGLGDAADLAELGTWAASNAADFLLVNPVHAAEPIAPMEPSPYLPTSRRFVNPIYIRVEEVADIGYLGAAERQLIEWHADDARRLNEFDFLDRDAAWAAKRAALRVLHRGQRSGRHSRDFAAFCAREGQALIDFATWCALAEKHGLPAGQWPRELHDPRSDAVAAARTELADEVDFHCWLQWVVQDQLASAHREARAAGMRVGVVHDIAVGVHPGGAEVWAGPEIFAAGVSVGAPPDDYNQLGQDWSQPPWRPDRLEQQAYRPLRDMLRTTLAMAGGLRIDHILGLFRLWWIPQGMKPTDGTYVRYDHEAMISVLVLEAHRAGAVVVGEDLGTVAPNVRDYLTDRGLLGTSVLWFERQQDGRTPRPPATYRKLALATVTVHDLPPTAGYLQGEHLQVRRRLGLLTRDWSEELAEDSAQRDAMVSALRGAGLLGQDASIEDIVEALYVYLAAAPSRLLGVSVNDLVGDVRTINQPGTNDEYPNWRLPIAGPDRRPLLLGDVMRSRRGKKLLRKVNDAVRRAEGD